MTRNILAGILLLTSPLLAEAVYYPAARISQPSSAMLPGPRHLALGEAVAILEGDLFTLRANPAGLAAMGQQVHFSLLYHLLSAELGMSQTMMAMGQNSKHGAWGFDMNIINLGDYDLRHADGAYRYTSSGMGISLGLGLAKGFYEGRLKAGLELDWSYESISLEEWNQVTGTLGASWRAIPELLMAFSVRKLGASQGDSVPATAVNVGAAFEALSRSVLVLAEAEVALYDAPSLHAGFEYRPATALALRGGWRQRLGNGPTETLSGPTAGLGATWKQWILDYAWVSYGYFHSHRAALTISIPDGFFKRRPTIIIEAGGGTGVAKAQFEAGQKLLANGQQLDALVAFKQAVQNDPEHAQAQKQVAIITKELAGAQSSSSQNKQMESLRKRYVEAGQKHLKAGEYKKAIAAYEIALEVDKRNLEAADLLNEARAKLGSLTKQLMDSQAQAIAKDDLQGGVRDLYEILKLDPDHAQAKSRLAALHKPILAEITRLHRLGIDAYVEGRFDEATEVWKKALALDPSDPKTIKRDIDRAKRLKNLRSEEK